jgi:hypothetical protein
MTSAHQLDGSVIEHASASFTGPITLNNGSIGTWNPV